LSGAGCDPRSPCSFVDILKKEGRTVDAVYYPQEGHSFMKGEDDIDEITRMVAWFDKYLKGAQ
jgi:dipeptidyl aminopeptidase/acylaminoacyl peptidase